MEKGLKKINIWTQNDFDLYMKELKEIGNTIKNYTTKDGKIVMKRLILRGKCGKDIIGEAEINLLNHEGFMIKEEWPTGQDYNAVIVDSFGIRYDAYLIDRENLERKY